MNQMYLSRLPEELKDALRDIAGTHKTNAERLMAYGSRNPSNNADVYLEYCRYLMVHPDRDEREYITISRRVYTLQQANGGTPLSVHHNLGVLSDSEILAAFAERHKKRADQLLSSGSYHSFSDVYVEYCTYLMLHPDKGSAEYRHTFGRVHAMEQQSQGKAPYVTPTSSILSDEDTLCAFAEAHKKRAEHLLSQGPPSYNAHLHNGAVYFQYCLYLILHCETQTREYANENRSNESHSLS
ncbi:hypothetical protein R3P38DRAFT_3507882 [Favolaschia claudopus]|uniref:Uncharacterized protein n=1 Tax=Favolaschia claudopus TaxID=2862362 RepID=A0AAW0C011_9AGAR